MAEQEAGQLKLKSSNNPFLDSGHVQKATVFCSELLLKKLQCISDGESVVSLEYLHGCHQ